MTDTVFCYHCRRQHPRDEVRLVDTKSGRRWRCIKSIIPTKRGLAAREDFGRQTTAFNQAMAACGMNRPGSLRQAMAYPYFTGRRNFAAVSGFAE